MLFQPLDPHLLFSKNDPEDPRLGECARAQDPFEDLTQIPLDADFFMLGYPDDEGIGLGGGRIGARLAPPQIRQIFYKMTPHLQASAKPRIRDLGDLVCENIPLSERHARGRAVVRRLTSENRRFISLGGGHDYGFADAAGFLDTFAGQEVVINLDAHLDVRPSEKKLSSGTPFYRMLGEFARRVEFFEFGLQDHCNSRAHWDWAAEKGARLYRLADLQTDFSVSWREALSPVQGRKVFLSIDIDSFAVSEAPGCSQSWTSGLEWQKVKPALSWLYENFDVRGLGIYEVSPPLDADNRTSKLAALILHQFVFASHGKKES
jgi:formiminoglutamase